MTDFWHALKETFTNWHHAKVFVEHSTSISHDTLHLVAGMLISLVVATLLRRPIASWVPWLATLAIILFNEAADLWIEIWPDHARQLGEGVKDIAVTMAIPTILMLAVRFNPKLFVAKRGDSSD